MKIQFQKLTLISKYFLFLSLLKGMNFDNEENQWVELMHDNDYEILTEEPFSIRKKSTGSIIKDVDNGDGYVIVYLNCRKYRKHRIIAETFIPNPDNLPEVDHINGIRNDNRLDNLRWVSRSSNCKNRGSNHNITYDYYDEINEDAIEVKKYSKWEFEDLYFDPENDTFYYYNGVRFRELHINEMKRTGALFVCAFDTENKQRRICYNKFKREYGLMKK